MWNYTYDVFGTLSAVDNNLVVLTGLGKVVIVEANTDVYT